MTPLKKIVFHASHTEFRRYFWAGSMTFLADFTVLLVLTEFFDINYLWSNFAGVSLGIVISYIFCVKWVFVNRKYNQVTFELPLFVLTCLVGLGLNELLMWTAVEFGDIHYLLAKILVTLLVFIFNFYFKKFFLFTQSKSHTSRCL